VPALETGLRLAGALHWLWHFRDHQREGLVWVHRALAQGVAAPTAVRAKALFSAGVLEGFYGADWPRSQELLAQSVALSREVANRRQLVMALGALGWITWIGGQAEQALAILDECLAVARAGDDAWPIAHALLHRLFRVANSAAIERAEERARAWTEGAESLDLYRAVGDPRGVADVQQTLGQIAQYEGDHERARALFAASLQASRALGWRSSVADVLVSLADVTRDQADYPEAAALYVEALTHYRHLGDRLQASPIAGVLTRLADLAMRQRDWAAAQAHAAEVMALARDTSLVEDPEIAGALEIQAALAAVQGLPDRALRLAGAATALRARLDRPLAAAEQATLGRRLAPARQALSEPEQATAWAAGQAMTPEQAIADALAGLPSAHGRSLCRE